MRPSSRNLLKSVYVRLKTTNLYISDKVKTEDAIASKDKTEQQTEQQEKDDCLALPSLPHFGKAI